MVDPDAPVAGDAMTTCPAGDVSCDPAAQEDQWLLEQAGDFTKAAKRGKQSAENHYKKASRVAAAIPIHRRPPGRRDSPLTLL